MNKVKPISPSEATARKKGEIPPFVIEVFNALIAENLREGGTATFRQEEAEARIRKHLSEGEQFPTRWLDVEPLYRNEGWEVEYDKPGYNENYPATFTFTIPF